jgi:ribonuclease-3
MSGEGAASAEPLQTLQDRLGYDFARAKLLNEALTHSSFRGDGGRGRRSNERMEFLGDRVLGLVIANLLFHEFPGEEVGALARRHAALVRREALVQVAETLGLAGCVRLSRGEEEAGGRRNPGLLGDACEALLAAIYLDGGFDAAAAVVRRLWRPLVERDSSPPKDPKTLLQEWAQAEALPLPLYVETDRSGPAHAPVFRVEVSIAGFEPVAGSGPSKRAAERAAAELMLTKLRSAHDA